MAVRTNDVAFTNLRLSTLDALKASSSAASALDEDEVGLSTLEVSSTGATGCVELVLVHDGCGAMPGTAAEVVAGVGVDISKKG